MEFEQFKVGQLYKHDVNKYDEGTKFDFMQSGAIFEIYFSRPTGDEIQDVTRGCFEIGFFEYNNIIFMLFRFGCLYWMDAPYTVHLSAPFTFYEPKPGTGYGLSVFLIDAATGIIKGMRYVGLSTEFSNKFRNAVELQRQLPFKSSDYFASINHINQNYSTRDLVKRASSWCKFK